MEGVTGLDNAAPVRTYSRPAAAPTPASPDGKPIAFPCSQWYAQHYESHLPKQFGTVVRKIVRLAMPPKDRNDVKPKDRERVAA